MRNGPYVMVKAPSTYPGKKYRSRYVYEHHLVWWNHMNQIVPDGYLIHHINEIKTDNRIDNLQLISRANHSSEHGQEAHIKNRKEIKCAGCQKNFYLKGSQFKKRTEQSNNLYCIRSCFKLYASRNWRKTCTLAQLAVH